MHTGGEKAPDLYAMLTLKPRQYWSSSTAVLALFDAK